MKRNRILIIDDQAFIRHIYQTELSGEGFEVICASSGKEALDYLQDHSVDLILLDAIMPVMDGFQTCRAIRRIETAHKVPIVFLTANSDKESVIKAVQAGGDDFFLKNADSRGLIVKIEKLLSKGEGE